MAYLMEGGLATGRDPARPVRSLPAEIERFDRVLQDLRRGDPARPLAPPRDAEVEQKLHRVEEAWQGTVRPLVAGFVAGQGEARVSLRQEFDGEVEAFVARINDLVLAMEHSYAANTNLLRSVQAALVVLAMIGTGIMIRFFMLLVIRPVGELHAGMRRMSEGDLAVRLPVRANDELGDLADGFNQMATHLQTLYSTLEERVEAKTRSLAERNRELGLLYEITAFLGEPAAVETLCKGFLTRVRTAMGADAGSVRLYVAATDQLYLTTHEGLTAEFVAREASMSCGDCLCGELIETGIPVVFDTASPPPGMKLRNCIREGFATATAFNVSLQPAAGRAVQPLFPRATRRIGAGTQPARNARSAPRRRHRKPAPAVAGKATGCLRGAQPAGAGVARLDRPGPRLSQYPGPVAQDSLRKGRAEEAMQTAGQLREGVQESYDDVRELLVHFRTRMQPGRISTPASSPRSNASRDRPASPPSSTARVAVFRWSRPMNFRSCTSSRNRCRTSASMRGRARCWSC